MREKGKPYSEKLISFKFHKSEKLIFFIKNPIIFPSIEEDGIKHYSTVFNYVGARYFNFLSQKKIFKSSMAFFNKPSPALCNI